MIPYISSLWRYSKILGVIILVGFLVRYYTEAEQAKKDVERLEANKENDTKIDSTGLSEVTLTKEEFKTELEYQNKALLDKLNKQGIELKQIKKVVSSQTTYKVQDTLKFILNEIQQGIKKGEPVSQKIKKETDCYVLEANIHYNGKDLTFDVINMGYNSETDVIAHTKKIGFRFWKWFRKKKVYITTLNSCGETKTRLINIHKK